METGKEVVDETSLILREHETYAKVILDWISFARQKGSQNFNIPRIEGIDYKWISQKVGFEIHDIPGDNSRLVILLWKIQLQRENQD